MKWMKETCKTYPPEVPGRKRAKLAVWPCTKLRPPTGPHSPAAKKPATGVLGMARLAACMSWLLGLNKRVPRPLQLKEQPPGSRLARGLGGQQQVHVLIRRRRVADMELHGLAHAHFAANGDRAAFFIRPRPGS